MTVQRSNWIDDVHEGYSMLRDTCSQLESLASNLDAVGNNNLATIVLGYAGDIALANVKISTAISLMINDEVAGANRAIGETFKAILQPLTKDIKNEG